MQVYVPLNRGQATYDDTKPFAHGLAKVLEQRHELIVSVMKKEVRKGKVFIDWSQNDRHKTTVGPYSLRARAAPDGVHAADLGRGRPRRRRRGGRAGVRGG